jgi:hypothetical protein
LITDNPAVIDTCVLINLLATDRVGQIVQIISPSPLVCPGVSSESLYLRSTEPDGIPQAVDLGPLFDQNVFTACPLVGDPEEELYVGYSLELDDGEAMSLAIAQSRNLALATDDIKARRLAAENAPAVSLLSTPQIIRAWAEGREPAEVASVVRAIYGRARFCPSDTDPWVQWWNAHLQT